MSRLLPIFALLLAVSVLCSVATPAAAQRSPQTAACAADKVQVSGAYMAALLDCRSRELKNSDAFAACVQHAGRKLDATFAAIERRSSCETTGDSALIASRGEAGVDRLMAMLSAPLPDRCAKRLLKAMSEDTEGQHQCYADAVRKGAGYSVDAACQFAASERFFTDIERALTHDACESGVDGEAIDQAIRASASGMRSTISLPVTTCRPIEVTALHGSNLQANSRLAMIENGQVPCMHVDDGTVTSCTFSTIAGRQSGEWLESPEGNFALVGQAVRLDGTPGGEYIVAARVSEATPASCIEPTRRDTMGRIAEGSELAATCIVEDLLTDYNARSADWGWSPMSNVADREVCTNHNPATNPHPDDATLVRSYAQSGSGPDDTFCYTGMGAALNDPNGAERDWLGRYYTGDGFCHYINVSGYEVPAAKRPATFSLPAPGVNTRSSILWRPVNPNVAIANGGGSPAVQIFAVKSGFLSATGATDATGPLPDLGQVENGTTVGSVVFSLAPGGDTLSIGAGALIGDWYPPRDGNEIALGYEKLQVQFAVPLYAFGFDFVEPNATMPSFGGVPGDSTFEIVLYLGSGEVGRVSFNAADDVITFVGIWSDRAFDRATIIDSTGNDDDEYFGQFYTSMRRPQ